MKKLREEFSTVRENLKKGNSFLVIYRSTPIAKLIPVNNWTFPEEAEDTEIEQAALADSGEETLTPAELKYYLSLK